MLVFIIYYHSFISATILNKNTTFPFLKSTENLMSLEIMMNTGTSFRLAARDILYIYTPPHLQDSTCNGLTYASYGALAETRTS